MGKATEKTSETQSSIS